MNSSTLINICTNGRNTMKQLEITHSCSKFSISYGQSSSKFPFLHKYFFVYCGCALRVSWLSGRLNSARPSPAPPVSKTVLATFTAHGSSAMWCLSRIPPLTTGQALSMNVGGSETEVSHPLIVGCPTCFRHMHRYLRLLIPLYRAYVSISGALPPALAS